MFRPHLHPHFGISSVGVSTHYSVLEGDLEEVGNVEDGEWRNLGTGKDLGGLIEYVEWNPEPNRGLYH